MKVYCKACHVPLTKEIELSGDYAFNETDGEDFLPEGLYTISDGAYFTGTEGCIIINAADLVNKADHPDPSRHNGCCGLDGCDGPNKICVNGHEVATEKSDCWMPAALIFEKNNTCLR